MRPLPLCVVVVGLVLVQTGCDICDGDGDEVRQSATILTQEDADDLEGVTCILADLQIGTDENTVDVPLDLSPLADLLIVEGDFDVRLTTQLVELDLPSLTFIGRRGLERDGERVRGGFFIKANTALSGLDLPDLTDVGGCFEVNDNAALDPGDVDDLFAQVKTHAFPGTCNAEIEANTGNTGGAQ